METLITRTLTTGALACTAIAIATGSANADTTEPHHETSPVSDAINTLGTTVNSVGQVVPLDH